MKATGTLLKEAREKQNLSISEVSMSTKINPKVISAIEEGREGQLPAKTFLKGFVRSYAIYLKLDVDTVMASLQQDLGDKPAEVASASATVSSSPAEVESPAISANPRILKGLAVGGVLFLIVMIVTVKSLVEKYEKEKAIDPAIQAELKPEEVPPTDEAAAPTEEVNSKEDEVKPAETETAATPTTPEPAAAQATPAVTPTPEAPKAVEAKPAETPKPAEVKPAEAIVATAPTAKPEVKVEAPKPVEVKPEPKPAEPTTASLKDNEIILEALDKVDITFVVNNGPTTRLSLQPAQVHTIKAKGQVAMDVSDGGAVNVIHNGQDNGTLGDLGKPKKVRYP